MPTKKKAYQPKHSAQPTSTTPTVAPAAPGKPGTKGPTSTRRRGPQHLNPSPPRKRSLGGAARTAHSQKKLSDVAGEARDYAYRSAVRRSEGKPSIVGRTAAGAAAGTAAGAVIGGPVGAAAGAALGGAGGAIAGAKAKKAYRLAAHANLGARRIVVAEFLICMVIVALSPLTDKKKNEGPTAFMRRMTAIMALFFILGLISAAGRGAGKFAAGLGGLVTVALAVSDRDLFTKVADLFSSGKAVGHVEPDETVDAPIDGGPFMTGGIGGATAGGPT